MRNRFSHRIIAWSLVSFAVFGLYQPLPAQAASVDLELDAGNVSFSESTLYVGDNIRIYARVRNIGDIDATAYVLFYQGGMVIGQSQPVSLRANGNPDDVFVDFTVPDGSFNIRAVLQGSTPQDVNPENDTAITPLYTPVSDADRDGVVDDADNCVSDANADQLDTDRDAKGDACDADDDGDGVSDASDSAPLDATETGIPEPMPVAVPAPVVATPTPTASTTALTAPASSSTASTSSTSGATASTTTAATTTAATAVENAVAAISNSTSKLTTSPLARFTTRQTDWRTYEFTLAEQPEDGVRFSWDFGDGATSVQSQITHAFSGPGTYTVTLAILNADGTSLSDAQTFDVSFFHLDNPQVMMLLGVLFAALFLFGFAFIKLRRSYDQGALHE